MTIDQPLMQLCPTRIALSLRAATLVALGFVFSRLLVLNPHDNAYLTPWLAGMMLFALAAPFAVAALLPAGRARRTGAWIAVALAWGLGGLCAALFLFYTVLIVGSALVTRRFAWSGVAAVHLIGAALLVTAVFGISRRLFPAAPPSPDAPADDRR